MKDLAEVDAFLAYLDDVSYLSSMEGIYDRVADAAAAKEIDGEPVTGRWVMAMVAALQVNAGIPQRCAR